MRAQPSIRPSRGHMRWPPAHLGVSDAIRALHLRGGPATPDSLAAILSSCAASRSLAEGRQIHAVVLVSGSAADPFVTNHLINMYGKCGSLDSAHSVFNLMEGKNLHSWNTIIGCYCKAGWPREARKLFDEMPHRDAVSWNTMISGYDQHGPCEEALDMFVRMRRLRCRVDHFGLSSVISACSNISLLNCGKGLHGCSQKIGLDLNVQVGSALIGLYVKCVEIEDARRIFDEMGVREQFTWNSMLAGYVQCSKIDDALRFFNEMPEKNVISWTAIIVGCSKHGRNVEAIGFFHKMREIGLKADQVTFVGALSVCIEGFDFQEGFKMHGLIVKSGYESNVFVGSVLVALYARRGCLESARSVVDGMDFVDDFSWSILIAEYAKHGEIGNACELFESLEVKSIPLWNALIGGYAELGLDEDALEAFREMQWDGMKGDEFTFGCLLMGAEVMGLTYGEQLHLQTIKLGIDSSVFVGSAFIDMYSSNLRCEAVIGVFNSIQEPNLVSWNAMISGYGLNNLDFEAVNTFRLMMTLGMRPDNITVSRVLDSCSSLLSLLGGMQVHALACKLSYESDVVVGSALIDLYAKCNSMECAFHAFSDIHQHNVVSWTALIGGYVKGGVWDTATELFNWMPERNIVSWNTMLSGHAKHGSHLEALYLYNQMNKSGQLPDHISFVSILTVCCNFLLEEHGKQVHAQIFKTGYHKNFHVNVTLTNMYQKLGKPMDKLGLGSKHGNSVDTAEADAISGSK